MNGLFNVIRAELFKAVRKRRTYLIAGLMWLVVPSLLLLIGWILQSRVAGTFADETVSVQEIVQLIASPVAITRNNLMLLGLLSPSLLIIVIALLAALFIGEERSQNMWKTVLTAQPNRLTVLTGKLIAAMTVFGVLLLGSYVSGLIFGSIGMIFLPTSFGVDWLNLAGLYGLQWLFGLTAMLFAFLLIWLIRNLPLGIVSIFFLPALIEGAYSFYSVVVGFDRINRFNALLEGLQIQNTIRDLPRYFFSTNLYAPSLTPLGQFAEVFGQEAIGNIGGPLANFLTVDLTRSALVMAVYALIFGVILVWSFTRQDVA